jgi:hypothetical protein
VFFGAETNRSAADISLHGLRGASNATDWITVGVRGSMIGNDNVATAFSDADLTACLAAIGVRSPIAKLRITGHSRGAIGAVAYASKTRLTAPLDRVTLLDEFQVGDPKAGNYHGKVEALLAAKIPASKIRGYETGNPAKVHVAGVDYRRLQNMATIGSVRLIRDAMALDPVIAAAAASERVREAGGRQGRTIKEEVESLPLPARGSLSSDAAAGAGSLQGFATAQAAAIAAIHTNQLVAFINRHDLTGWGATIDWTPYASHEFFVGEIAAELYD